MLRQYLCIWAQMVLNGKLLNGMPLSETLSVSIEFKHKTFEILKVPYLTTLGLSHYLNF